MNSTLSANTAQGGDGASLSESQGAGGSGYGGGLFNLNGAATVLNSTFASNTVTAGSGGTPQHDGGGIYTLDLHTSPTLPTPSALLHIENTIVANSIGATTDFVSNGGVVTGSGNLVESNSGVAAGVIATSADPQLGALADNGGPTFTHALKPTSPAREAGGLLDEIQQVTVVGVSGTFTLTFNGQTTSALAFNATGAQVQSALNALSTIGGAGGSVLVAQNAGQYTVVFGGSLANANVPAMTTTGAGGATSGVTTVANGGGPVVTADQRGTSSPQDGDNSGTAVIDIGAFEAPNPYPVVNLTAGAGPWTAKLNGNVVELTNGAGTLIFSESQDALAHLQINGTFADDTLIVDSSNGLVALQGVLSFDGAGGFNTLQLAQTGGATQTTDTYSVGPNPGDIRSVIVGPSGTQTVVAANLAPVLDLVPATTLTVSGTNAANSISYSQGSVLANGLVAVDEFETIEFSNKVNVIINAAGGADTVTLTNQTIPTGLTRVTVNGDAGNDVITTGPGVPVPVTFNGGIGDDLLDASGTTAGASLNGNEGDDTLRGGSGNDILDGGAGDDAFAGNGGSDNVGGGLGSSIGDTILLPGTTGSDTFALALDANGRLVATVNGVTTTYANFIGGAITTSGIEQIAVQGLAGADALTVDATSGATAIPIDFDGGDSADLLTLTGGTATSDIYTPGPNPGQGTSTIVIGGVTQTVTFSHLEPVIDLVAGPLVVNANDASNAITYAVGRNNANTADDTTRGKVVVDGQEFINFSNKTTLTLNAFGGADTISLNNPNTPTGLTGITVNGGDPTGSDTLIVNGTTGNDTIGYTPSSTEGAGGVTLTGAPAVTFATIEQLSIDGQGGTDALTVTSTTGRRVTYTPGSAPDSGLIEVANFGAGTGLVPLSFAHIGAVGSITLAGSGDILQLNGTSNSDTFNVTGSTAQIINATSGFASVLLNLSNIFSAELRGLDGEDTFNFTGSLAPLSGGVVVDGGNPSGSDTVNLTGATGAVVINPANTLFSALDNVFGFGTQVNLLGVERLNVNAAFNQVTLAGSSESEDLHVTLDEIQAATITKAGSPLTIHTSNTTALLVEGAGGDDTLNLHGTSRADTITVNKGLVTTVAAAGLGLTVSAPTITLENVRIDAGAGVDAINVSGTTNNGQGLEILGGSPTSNAGAVADTLNVTMSTAGTTALVPGATPDAGAITSPDGTTTFSGIELVGLTGAGGANTLNLQGTHASDTMAVQFLGGANRTWINDRGVASFANFATVNVNGLFGDDKFSIAPAGLVGVTTINVAGGDPSASDELIVTATSGADTFTFTGTSASAGAVVLAGGAVVNFTTTENVILDGQAGNDLFQVASAKGRVELRGGEDSDTVNFTGAASGVVFDLDLVDADQAVNSTGEIIRLGDIIENFTGTAFNDVLRVKAALFARTVLGGIEATLPPGDTLIFDGAGAVVNLVSVDTNTGTFKTVGYADVVFDEFETKTITNSPSGPGGFGSPGTSDAFSTAHIYDSALFKVGGKLAPGKAPTAVATGDLNGDGFADMVVANSKTKNLSILINGGNGTFLDPVNISTVLASPQDLVLGDFDGDGNLDAAVSHPGAGKISFFKGDGAGNFAAPTTTVTPKFKPFALTTGDMNGDGNLDIIAVAKATNAVAVVLGNGAGAFTPGAPVKTLGKNSIDVVVADFNGDGDLDVATANLSSNNVSFLAGDGTGALGAAARFATGVQPSSLAAADLDNDGDLDLAVSNAVSRFVTVLLGNGAAPAATQFAPQLRVSVPGNHQSTSIVVGDFDGDGVTDLGLGNRVGPNFTILRGLGAAAYTQPFEFNLGKDPASAVTGGIALADFNNDGLLDITATSLLRNDVRVLLRQI